MFLISCVIDVYPTGRVCCWSRIVLLSSKRNWILSAPSLVWSSLAWKFFPYKVMQYQPITTVWKYVLLPFPSGDWCSSWL